MTLPFKVVAVDMDGTFYDDHKHYDHEMFGRLWARMQELGIKFVPASGNQVFKLKQDFLPWQNELSYVADNGAVLAKAGQVVATEALDHELMLKLISFLERKYPEVCFLVSGRHRAYTLNSYPQSYLGVKHGPHYYYPRIQELDTYQQIPVDEDLVKIAANMSPEAAKELVAAFNQKYGPQIYPTFSGNFAADIMKTGISKATGLAYLLKTWGYQAKDLLVFGDGENDLSMMQLAGKAYAMANADQTVKQAADAVAPSNNEQGVLKVLSQYLLAK